MMSKNKLTTLIVLLAVVLLCSLSAYFYYQSRGMAGSSEYKAIFLSSGQVYFGEVTDEDEDFLTLSDVYYLQLKNQEVGQENPSDLSLVKLGDELHGPKNFMQINKDAILFIEELADNSKVLKTITGK